MDEGIDQLEMMVVVDVIEMEQRKETGIRPLSRQSLADISRPEMTFQHPRREAVGVFVEITEHHARSRILVSEDSVFEQAHDLLPPFEECGSKVNIVDVDSSEIGKLQIDMETTSAFPPRNRDVEVPLVGDPEVRQHRIAVQATLMEAILPEIQFETELFRQKTRLILLETSVVGRDDLLERDYVGIQFPEHIRDAHRTGPQIETPAFVDVVGDYPESLAHLTYPAVSI